MMVVEKSFPIVGSNNNFPNRLILNPGSSLSDIERIVILETLKYKNFNRTHTAKILGIGIRTLQRKLKKYGFQDSGWGRPVDPQRESRQEIS